MDQLFYKPFRAPWPQGLLRCAAELTCAMIAMGNGWKSWVSNQYAMEVAQMLLESTGDAIMSGDFERFRQYFLLPHKIDTFEGQRHIEGPADLDAVFRRVRNYIVENDITMIVREVIECAQLDQNTIQSTHQSQMLSGSKLIEPTYPSLSRLVRHEGNWLISDSQYALPSKLASSISSWVSWGTSSKEL